MVAGFAEDIDSDDEDITPVVNNHVDEELDDDPFTTPKKSNTALTVELTSSEEDKEDEEDKVEVEKRNDGMRKGKEELKTEETQKRESGSMKLGFEIPAKSLMTEEPVVDGLGLATDDVDDWLNSPDTDPKVLLLQTVGLCYIVETPEILELSFPTDRKKNDSVFGPYS